MFEWFNRLFGAPASSSVAKERLRLVLLSDHIALAPDVVEELRRDLIEVISRYVVVDERNSDVSFEHKDQGIAMLANIPILSLRDRQGPPPSIKEEPVAAPVGTNGHAAAGGLMAAAPLPAEAAPTPVPAVVAERVEEQFVEAAVAADQEPAHGTPAPRRRKRRRKPSGLPTAAPAQ